METEQNTPLSDEGAQVAARDRMSSLIDSASESVFSEDKAEPKPEPKPEAPAKEPADEVEDTPAEVEPEPDAPPQEQDSTTTPAAEPDATPQGHPLTDDEEFILRRNGATDEELDSFRALTVDQRNKLLRPLRAAQHKLNTIYGMTAEERNRTVEAERKSSASMPGQISEAVQPTMPRIEPDAGKIEAVAAALGITPEAAKQLADAILDPIRTVESNRIQAEAKARQDEWNRTINGAVTSAHTELAKQFPRLKEIGEVNKMLAEPETEGLFAAKVKRGMDVGKAMHEALKERATLKYLPELQQQRQAARAAEKKAVLNGSAEPTNASVKRGPAVGKAKARNLDEAHEQVWAENA